MTDQTLIPTYAGPAPIDNRSGASRDAELVEVWLGTFESPSTLRSYARTAGLFLIYLDDIGRDLRSCTVADLQEWQQSLAGSKATVAQRTAALKSLLTFAKNTGYCLFNVGTALKPPKIMNTLAERILSEEEVFKLLGAAPTPRCGALLRFLYGSAARISEACDLQWEHVHRNEDDEAVVTLHGKGGKTRHVTITQGVLAAIDEDLPGDHDPGEYVFQTRTGRRLHPSAALRMIKRAAAKAEIGTHISPHWLRHAHASHALDRGAPVHVVQATLGHASLATTTKYVHVKPGESSGKYLGV